MNNNDIQDFVFWYLSAKPNLPLREKIKTEVVIVGGGMTGLSTALSFIERGIEVVLIEKNFCGSGASGKSSGFITPDSELSLTNLEIIYGLTGAKKIWEFIATGTHYIKGNIFRFNLNCDYRVEDTFIVANSKKSFETDILVEHEMRKKYNFESNLYQKHEVPDFLGSQDYFGAIKYSNTFSINAFKYCQNLKEQLINLGVKVYEDTEAIKINKNSVITKEGEVFAKYIILATDRFTPDLNKLNYQVFHIQTFLMASAKLTNEQIREIFPKENLMVWDTDLVYQYYRSTPDNRILLGGGGLFDTYNYYEKHKNYSDQTKLINYFKRKFPKTNVNFRYIWPGLIGVTKDLMPIVGFDSSQKNLYYLACPVGLPWAAAIGKYAVQDILDNNNYMHEYFNPQRKFLIPKFIEKLIGKYFSFSISNFFRIQGWR